MNRRTRAFARNPGRAGLACFVKPTSNSRRAGASGSWRCRNRRVRRSARPCWSCARTRWRAPRSNGRATRVRWRCIGRWSGSMPATSLGRCGPHRLAPVARSCAGTAPASPLPRPRERPGRLPLSTRTVAVRSARLVRLPLRPRAGASTDVPDRDAMRCGWDRLIAMQDDLCPDVFAHGLRGSRDDDRWIRHVIRDTRRRARARVSALSGLARRTAA